MQPDTSEFKLLVFASEFLVTAVVFVGFWLIFKNFRKKQDENKEQNKRLRKNFRKKQDENKEQNKRLRR